MQVNNFSFKLVRMKGYESDVNIFLKGKGLKPNNVHHFTTQILKKHRL